jgi:hypothetical protein
MTEHQRLLDELRPFAFQVATRRGEWLPERRVAAGEASGCRRGEWLPEPIITDS